MFFKRRVKRFKGENLLGLGGLIHTHTHTHRNDLFFLTLSLLVRLSLLRHVGDVTV